MEQFCYRLGGVTALAGIAIVVVGAGPIARLGGWLALLGVLLAVVSVLSAVRPSRGEALGSVEGHGERE